MKFEEAYCETTKMQLTINEAKELFMETPIAFAERIKGHLFCPECKQPRLAFHNAQTPYFSTYPLEEHQADCTLRQEELSRDAAAAYVNSKFNFQEIKRQIDSLIVLLGADTQYMNVKDKKGTKKDENAAKADDIYKRKKKRLPRKRIDVALTDDDYDCYKLFYGAVSLIWEKDEKRPERNKLLIRTQDGRRFLCRVIVRPQEFAFVPSEYKKSGQFLGKIVFLACFDSFSKKYKYPFVTLQRGEWLKIAFV